MSLEIVEHDDVAFLQSRQEMVLEPGFERLGVHGVVVGLGAMTPLRRRPNTKVIAL